MFKIINIEVKVITLIFVAVGGEKFIEGYLTQAGHDVYTYTMGVIRDSLPSTSVSPSLKENKQQTE